MQTSTNPPESSDLAETAAWYWLAHDSGLGIRRAKVILFEHLLAQPYRLCEILEEAPSIWEAMLGLKGGEREMLEQQYEGLERVGQQLAAWQTTGMGLLRYNQAGYPPTLTVHLPPEERPLFLSYRGEGGLLELPAILALCGDDGDEEAITWIVETQAALAYEGALPMAIAQPGADATIVRALLQLELPLALVIPQGLAGYQPPAALNIAIEAGRALLLSPFRPDWSPPDEPPNPMLPFAADFAQALANALLLASPPYPRRWFAKQPCFLRPGIAEAPGCQRYYSEPEDLFLQLMETPVGTAVIEAPPLAPQTATPPSDAEPQLDAETLIEQLSELGNVPEAMKARLRAMNQPKTDDQ